MAVQRVGPLPYVVFVVLLGVFHTGISQQTSAFTTVSTGPATTANRTGRFQTPSDPTPIKAPITDCVVGDGVEYRGNVSITRSGRTCQRWDADYPHRPEIHSKEFPNAGLVGNFCRNPMRGFFGTRHDSPWCYTTDPNVMWEGCDIPQCPALRVEVVLPRNASKIAIGETVTLNCVTTESDGIYRYSWELDGEILQAETNRVFLYTARTEGVHSITCHVFHLSEQYTSLNHVLIHVLNKDTITLACIMTLRLNFTSDLEQLNSPAAVALAQQIELWVQSAVESKGIGGVVSVRVKAFRPGSVIVDQNIYVENAGTSEEELIRNVGVTLMTYGARDDNLLPGPVDSLEIRSIVQCLQETVEVNSVTLTFPSTPGGRFAYSTERCPSATLDGGPPKGRRSCSGDIGTGMTWSQPFLLDCNQDLQTLAETEVTNANLEDVATALQLLTLNGSILSAVDTTQAAQVLDNIATVPSVVPTDVGYSVLDTVDHILDAPDDVLEEIHSMGVPTSRIVQSLEVMLDKVSLTGTRFHRILPNIAVESMEVPVSAFSRALGFVWLEGEELDVMENGRRILKMYGEGGMGDGGQVEAAISLPKSLQSLILDKTGLNDVKLNVVVYQNSKLFTSNQSGLSTDGRPNSRVLATWVTDVSLQHLLEPVILTFQPLQEEKAAQTNLCATWNFSIAGGSGAWSPQGCTFVGMTNGSITCSCDHLTNFAVLVGHQDKKHEGILSLISTIGCALSLGGLVFTLIPHLAFRSLRKTKARFILINLCLALLSVLVVFFVGLEAAVGNTIGCMSVAFLLHYCLLAAFLWMAVEAFVLYQALWKVLGVETELTWQFALSSILIGWGLPGVAAGITIALHLVLPVPGYTSDSLCWMSGLLLYYGFLVPLGVILLFNTIMFIIVIRSLTCAYISRGKLLKTKRTRKLRSEILKQLRISVTVMVLVGLSWGFGFFLYIKDAGIVFAYLFCIFNSLQGFFIFIFQCVMQKVVRAAFYSLICRRKTRQWRVPETDIIRKNAGHDVTVPLTDVTVPLTDIADMAAD
ncbi:ADGRG7 [Branchiostoma lanceolatum]|uniref:ADGRG7 protein n=1 Tax=Branchiostoma lanceolatum TaxID=7740 RepID=A0A8K0EKE9_BRALA|nr:ADGRG7 [Branchiostoma lanceolatum]CAH1251521.1 ADGRG7 [Branchiostoma lanceolatum]